MQNAMRLKEQKARRENDLRQGLRLYKYVAYPTCPALLLFTKLCPHNVQPRLSFCSFPSRNAKYEEALEKFESVLGSKPTPDEASVASYNVACCYSQLNEVMVYTESFRKLLLNLEFV